MEFKLAEIRVEDVFNKSVDDIFLDVLDYVYDITRRQYGSKADFKSRTSYWKYDDNDTYDYFVGVLKCIALNISNINYTVEDMEVDVSGDFKFEDVFDCSYEEFYKKVMIIISDSLKDCFSLTDKNLVEIFKLFTECIVYDIGFLEVCEIIRYLANSDLTKDQFKDLLPEVSHSDFDKFIQDYESMGGGSFDSCQACRESVLHSLNNSKNYKIDLIGISNQLKEG